MASEANPGFRKMSDIYNAMSREEKEKVYAIAREEVLSNLKSACWRGKRKGMEEGIRIERVNIANNLINLGMNDEFVSTATDLTPEEIQKLRNQE